MVRHQPQIHDDAPCCPLANSSRVVASDRRHASETQKRVGSLYVLCSSDGSPVAETFAEFEDWLARTFLDVRVVDGGKAGSHALDWMRHDCESRSRLDGWLSRDRTTVYLIGDPDLARETALAVRGLFWAKGVDVSDIGVARLGRTVDLRRPARLDAAPGRHQPRHVPERRGSRLRQDGRPAAG